MDNGQSSGSIKMDGAMVLHVHEKESVGSPDDTLVRRLKNRERQRRYRARKRHEADLKKALVPHQSISLHYQHMPAESVAVPVEAEVLKHLSPTDYVTRIHCRRDWKKDARRAHLLDNSNTAASGGSLATFLESDVKSDIEPSSSQSHTLIFDNSATQRLQSNRRHWKTEARNKRSSE